MLRKWGLWYTAILLVEEYVEKMGERSMKAVALCGSPNAHGNTERLLKHALDRLAQKGIEGDLVRLQWKKIFPCLHCGACGVTRDARCSLEGDDFADIFRILRQADVLLIGAPVDRGAAASALKPFLERAGRVSIANGMLFSRKLGAPLAVVSREVSKHTLQRLLTWFPAQNMVVPGSPCFPVSKEAVTVALRGDEAGEKAVDGLADNLAWLAGKLAASDTPLTPLSP